MRMRDRRPARNAGRGVKLASLWGGIIVTLVGFGAAVVTMTMRPPDAYLACQQSAIKAVAATIVIIDPTDKFEQTHLNRIRTTIESERDRLPKGGRLTLLSVNPGSPWEPSELLSVCNPGSPGEADILFETRAQVEKRWKKAYAEPIEAAIAKAGDGTPSSSSPILITIAAALNRPDFDARAANRRLVLISDLLEHEQGGYSQLKGDLGRPVPASLGARFNLKGVAVEIDYLVRGQYARIQGDAHRKSWVELLRQAGASEVIFAGLNAPVGPETGDGERLARRAGRK